jgi:hypothetical protein
MGRVRSRKESVNYTLLDTTGVMQLTSSVTSNCSGYLTFRMILAFFLEISRIDAGTYCISRLQ